MSHDTKRVQDLALGSQSQAISCYGRVQKYINTTETGKDDISTYWTFYYIKPYIATA